MRVDAHSELEPDYTRRALATLDRVRAANVGGVMRADGRTPFQRAVARAYNSPVGLGGGAYHGGAEEGEAESAYLGVLRRAVLDEVGLFDETIRRGEDWELNLRIRRAGYRVWFDPSLSVTYWPRESWTRLIRQFSATGRWRGELVRRYGRGNSLRFFAPPALVATIALAIVVAVLQATGVLSGWWAVAGIRRLSAAHRVRRPRDGGRPRARRWQGLARQALDGCGAADHAPLVGMGLRDRRAARRPRHRRHLAAGRPEHAAALTRSGRRGSGLAVDEPLIEDAGDDPLGRVAVVPRVELVAPDAVARGMRLGVALGQDVDQLLLRADHRARARARRRSK